MPSALENLIKILKLEQKNGYDNKAVIGGMQAYAPNWSSQARQQAQKPEQHALIEELVRVMADYDLQNESNARRDLAKYMLDRITRRREALPQYEVSVADLPPMPLPAPPPESPPNEAPAPVEHAPPRASAPSTDADAFPTDVLPVEFVPLHRAGLAKAPKPLRRRRRDSKLERDLETLKKLAEPVTAISGVGAAMATKLEKIGPQTVLELLYLFPRRYDDYTKLLPLNKVPPQERVTIIATVRQIYERVSSGKRKMLVLKVDDGTASMDINFFNQPWLKRQFKIGMQLVFSGKTDLYLGKTTLNNPEWEPIDQESLHTGGIVPVYPLTKGISARTMRRMMKKIVDEWADRIPDHVPESVLDRAQQVDLGWALHQMHFPEKQEYIDYARERLAFDELLTMQLGVMANRADWQSQPAAELPISDEWFADFQAQLPFALTGAQVRAIEAIRADMAQPIPANRLLQGDVGSGKTMVAAVALAAAALNGKQAVMMAPTSILAEQHYQKLRDLFAKTPGLENSPVALLTGGISEPERRAVYQGLADGSISIVIGTHAVIQGGVEFHDLGAAVIDEQHRFGVEQRGALRGKGTNPHLLVMSATPIPRTLALTLYADLDLSVLDEMPPGRTPIQTRLITAALRGRAYEFIEKTVLERGQQAYIIYPLVEASESVEAGSAVEGYEQLQRETFRRYKLGLMHGRLKPAEKEEVMGAFSRNELQVLVSTSVIEVGVDVPNATAILIEGADRFGLAQLHQFRGRVGRGDLKSYCILVSEEATPRLEALEATTDGFKLAELDWELRGAGDLLGLRQSGSGQSEVAKAMDSRLVALAQQESRTLFAEDPRLTRPEHTLLAKRVHFITDSRADLS